MNMTNLTYSYASLGVGATQSWVLPPTGQPGSDLQVVLGLNRYAMPGAPGALYAGILQFSDSFGFSELDVAVSARTASTAGLWVGEAQVSQVANYLKIYQRNQNNQPVVSSNGAYVVSGINTNLGAVARPYPLLLIVHYDGTNAFLLQRVYYGLDAYSNVVVAANEGALAPQHLDTARRISAAHLPYFVPNTPWPLQGRFAQGTNLTATIGLAYNDQASNPFLHTYHPDHDNLDALFATELPRGSESYGIARQISLYFSPPGDDFTSITSAGLVSGSYLESIAVLGLGAAQRTFNVSGAFALNRLTDISTLTRP